MHMPVWFILFASFWGFNAFVALWKQKFVLCLVFFSQICIASLFATGTWPADLPSIATAIVMAMGLWWMIIFLAAALRAMGRAVRPIPRSRKNLITPAKAGAHMWTAPCLQD